MLHAHTALQESELARSGGGARARPAGVGAGLPAKAGDSVSRGGVRRELHVCQNAPAGHLTGRVF